MEDKDLFSEIRDAAHEWQEPYEQGAWEDFRRNRKRKRGIVVFWRYAGVAAVFLLLFLGGVWYTNQREINSTHKQVSRVNTNPNQLNVSQKPSDAEPTKDAIVENVFRPAGKNRAPMSSVRRQLVKSKKTINAHVVHQLNAAANNELVTTDTYGNPGSGSNNRLQTQTSLDSTATAISRNNTSKTLIANAPVKKVPPGSHSLYDSLTNRVTDDKKKSNHNLTYALAINPSVGNKKMSFGAGLEVFYPVSDHLSLGSGLGFASLHAETENSGGNAIIQLQGSNLDINGIELPINFKYQLSGGFYVNAGISAVAVLNNQLAYHYFTPTTQTITQFDGKGSPHQAIQLASAKSTEQSKEQLASYIGFYTFSTGKKQTFGKSQFSFGPFIKIPFNPISSQNIRFTQGGFNLSFSF
ncbi:hypothetical protein [Mucilaginibacter panaciglaebae]|uniref:Outer membrane protein with beta-barrel domain n=1 Tax=Mucilaginibacter panaciglaebae TaxID=502331 RepID=A0ABP7WF49_9SPHI